MTLIKTGMLNAIAVGVRMLTLLAINKILAIYVGPAGYAVIGQFQNALQIISTLASGSITTGVTKYTAEYHEDEAKQRAVWQTAGSIALAGSILISILVFAFSEFLAEWFLGDRKLKAIFNWLSYTLVLFVFNSLLLAILNGRKDLLRYVIANISGSIFALSTTGVLVVAWALEGALIALATYQSFSFFITLYICQKTKWFTISSVVGKLDKEIAINLAKYTAMALTTAATVSLTHILIRNHIGEILGWDAAGYWEAMWRLSGAYLMLITTTLGVYYLPRISEIKKGTDVIKEIYLGYSVILPISIGCTLLIYMLRDEIIVTLFSDAFIPMGELFFWHLIGDNLKIASWILSYVLLGKTMTKMYIISEILFAAVFYWMSVTLVEIDGVAGVAKAYAISYMLYWFVMMFVINRYLRLLK